MSFTATAVASCAAAAAPTLSGSVQRSLYEGSGANPPDVHGVGAAPLVRGPEYLLELNLTALGDALQRASKDRLLPEMNAGNLVMGLSPRRVRFNVAERSIPIFHIPTNGERLPATRHVHSTRTAVTADIRLESHGGTL